jgi:hypothetical protein
LFIDTYYSLSKFETTLVEDFSINDDVMVLSGTENLPEYGWLTVGGTEVVKYTSIVDNVVSGLERTTPRNWDSGTFVDQRYNAEVINSLIEELK